MKIGMNIQRLTVRDKLQGVQVRATVRSARDKSVFYNVVNQRKHWTCDCPHAKFRRPVGGCKHVKAVRNAVA
jgi:hypothetical protein